MSIVTRTSSRRAPGGEHELAMRPKVVWRLVNAGGAAIGVWLAVVVGPWWWWAVAGVFVVNAVAAQRQYMWVADGVLYRRGILRWREPLLLSELRHVSLRRRGRPREPYLPLELWLEDRNGRFETVTLRWWDRSEDLLVIVAGHISSPSPAFATMRTWNIDLDPRTEQRLARYAYRNQQ